MLKQCTKCGEEKKLEEFHKQAAAKDGRFPHCKLCEKARKARKYAEDPDQERLRARASYHRRRDSVRRQQKEHYDENLERMRKRARDYHHSNYEQIRERRKTHNVDPQRKVDYMKRYNRENRPRLRVLARRRHNRLMKTSPEYALQFRLRDRLNKAIKNDSKSGSAVRDLGCSIEELKRHLESKFNSRMNWKNWGTYWHIDHFFPLAQADLEDRVEFLAVCNWRNLQPLTATANMKKGDTVLPEARELFEELKAEFSREAAA